MFTSTAFRAAAGIPSGIGFTTGPSEPPGGGSNPPVPPPPPAPPAPPQGTPATGPQDGPNGFPEGTALSEMTPTQRESYWRHHARRHEDASKAKDAELAALKPKAEQYDALAEASKTEAEKAIEEAARRGQDTGRQEAEQAAVVKYGKALVQARFESVLAGRMTPDQVATLVGGLNVTGFLGTDGLPDQSRISEYVAAIPVAAGAPKTPELGGGRTSPPPTSGVAAGHDLYAQRHPKRTTQ